MSLRDLAEAALAADEMTRDPRRSPSTKVLREVRSVVLFEALAIVTGEPVATPAYGPGGLLDLANAIADGEVRACSGDSGTE